MYADKISAPGWRRSRRGRRRRRWWNSGRRRGKGFCRFILFSFKLCPRLKEKQKREKEAQVVKQRKEEKKGIASAANKGKKKMEDIASVIKVSRCDYR
jgi:hypothetical protein